MIYHCIHHTDEQPCPVKMGQEAADIIRSARTEYEAGSIAIEAMRQLAKLSGTNVPYEILQHATSGQP